LFGTPDDLRQPFELGHVVLNTLVGAKWTIKADVISKERTGGGEVA
jgi:hypothetical protein